MARRRKHEDEHENHERWLVSYADFITLLFAFFVVMYSLSSVNEGKYRIMSDSVVNAFRKEAQDQLIDEEPELAQSIRQNDFQRQMTKRGEMTKSNQQELLAALIDDM